MIDPNELIDRDSDDDIAFIRSIQSTPDAIITLHYNDDLSTNRPDALEGNISIFYTDDETYFSFNLNCPDNYEDWVSADRILTLPEIEQYARQWATDIFNEYGPE